MTRSMGGPHQYQICPPWLERLVTPLPVTLPGWPRIGILVLLTQVKAGVR